MNFNWIAFGNCIVAAALLCAVAAICIYALRILGRKHSSFLVVFTAFSVVATINAQKVNNLLTGFTGLTGLGGVNLGALNSADSLTEGHTVTLQTIATRRDVTDTDIVRGWKIESVVTNAVSFAMPEDAALVGNWHIHGARSSFGNNRVDFGEWRFPIGTNGEAFSSFWYFVDGRIRPTPKDAAREICAVGVPMAAVPGESRLWTKELLDGSRILTWGNFFLGGDTNAPINAQISLSPNGDFSVRSNDVLTVCRRIYPDDFDGDGLANEIDIAPKSYDGDYFGVTSPLPEGALESAYCWVDLCVTGTTDKATVRVACDGTRDLGDHVIIAKPNQVFRVPLLKGPWYDIESTSPVSVVATSSQNVEVMRSNWSGGRIMYVRNPVNLWFENNGSLCVLKSSENVGAQMSDLTGGCCLADITSLGFRWCCDISCNCGGNEHELGVTASWEGYTTTFGTWMYCTCISDDAEGTDSGAKISISFQKNVIIFENCYTNSPGDVVSDKSTVNTLSVSVYGGQYGGMIELEMEGDEDRLLWNGGDIIISPDEIAAGERVDFKMEYTAYKRSNAINDIKARLRFTENFTGEVVSDEATMTAVQVEVEPLVTIGNFFNRHIVGIGENVICRVYPRQVQWGMNFNTNTFVPDEYNEVRFYCPFYGIDKFLNFTVLDTEFASAFKVEVPNGVCVRNARELLYSDAVVNKAGWVGMVLDLVVLPTNVCFSALHIMEVPENKDKIAPIGYFSREEFSAIWHHTEERGAGVWHRVQRDNHFLNDEAQCGEELSDDWSDGQITWKVPVVWGHIENGSEDCRQNEFGNTYYQIFTMSSNGTLRVVKFEDYWVERTPQGVRNRSDKVHKGLL